MAFLTLNGINVPVEEGSSEETVEDIGRRQRAYAGNMLTTRRARKRKWQQDTPLLSSQDADVISSVAAGTGDSYNCNWSVTDTADRYSAKGVKNSSTKYGAVVIGRGADGYKAVTPGRASGSDAVNESAFGTAGSLSTVAAEKNYLTAGAADASDVGEFTASGATMTLSTSRYLFGSSSIKGVMNADTDYIETTLTSSSGSLALVHCTGTMYVWTDTTIVAELEMIGNNGDSESSGTALDLYVLYPNVWNKLEVNWTVYSSNTEVKLRFQPNGGLFSSGTVVYIDGMKVETSDYATAWSAGQAAADANRTGGPVFDASFLNSPRFTIGTRVRVPTTLKAIGTMPFFELANFDSAGTTWYQSLSVYITGSGSSSSSYNLVAILRRFEPGAADATIVATSTMSPSWDGEWASVVVTVKSDQTANTMTLYHITPAGVATSSTSSATAGWTWPSVVPDCLTTTPQIELGSGRSISETTMKEVIIDDVYAVNAVMSEDQIKEVHSNATVEWGSTPYVIMEGDIMGPGTMSVLGSIDRKDFTSANPTGLSGGWEANVSQVRLVLEEE